jgi:AbrB family looped-hinge helix DNA binding protein
MGNDQEKQIFGVVKIGDKGQIVIPKEAREVFGLKPGDSLLVLGDITKGIALVKTKVFDDAVEEVFK